MYKNGSKRCSFLNNVYNTEVSIALLLIRCFVGVMMLTHAIDKIKNFTDIAEGFPTPFGLNSWVALMIITTAEFGCSILIIAGLATRVAALILMIVMATAAFFTFPSFSLSTSELSMLYLAIYTFLFITGGGQYSTDRFIHRYYEKNKVRG